MSRQIPQKKIHLPPRLIQLSLICSALWMTGSCLKKKASPYTNYKLEEAFRYPILSEPPTLDWNKSTDTTSSLVIQNLMEGLTEYDFADGFVRLRPALAQSWRRSPDKKTWRFILRDKVLWTDGQALTARHFIDGWERLLNPKTGSEYAYFLFPIKNAKAYSQGKITDFKQVAVRENSRGELIVQLEKGISYFPYLLTHPSTFPIRKDIIEKNQSLWTHPERIATLGPYKLQRWDHDKALILVQNKNYYGEAPSVKKVILYIIPEETAVMSLYSSGRLDIATPLLSRDLPFLRKRKDHRQHNVLSLYYYGFNVKAEALKDARMRRAIAHSVSRKEIVRLLNRGNQPLKSWIPEGLFAHNKNIGLEFNPKKARALLKEMGYKASSDLPKIQIFYNTTADHKMIAENIQSQLKRNLDLNAELNNQEWKTYLQRLKTKNVELFRLGWQADYPDPDNFMNLMASFSDNNHTGWKNKTFDQLIIQAMTAKDGPQRQALYDKAQKILLEEDVAVFPIFTGVSHILISPRIKSFPKNVMDYILFKKVEINTGS